MFNIIGHCGGTAPDDASAFRRASVHRLLAALALTLCTAWPAFAWELVGDRIETQLTLRNPSAAHGREIVSSRQIGLCVLCHNVPIPEATQQGNVGPDLTGVGKRLSVPQLRARLVAPRQINPDSKMPSYLKVDGLNRVNPMMRGSAIFNEQQIEDVVAYLATLTDTP